MSTELSIEMSQSNTPLPPVVIGIVVVYCLYWFFYLISLCFNKDVEYKNEKVEKVKTEKLKTEKVKIEKNEKNEKVEMSITDIIESVDKMQDDHIHDLLAHLTKRCIILNWYDRDHLSMILGYAIDRKEWDVIIRRQDEMADATNDLVHEWADCLLEEISSESHEEQDTQKTLEEVLHTLSNNQLRLYAGVTSTNKTKAELVDMILQQLQNNMKRVIDRKLERMASLLS